MYISQTWRVSALALLFLVVATGCQQLHFRKSQLVSTTYDAQEQSTRVRMQFTVLDNEGIPVNNLTQNNFTIWEDGVLATSESVAVAAGDLATLGITILVDASKSMYDASLTGEGSNAVVEVKNGVRRFVERLHGHGPYDFVFYRFAVDVGSLANIDGLPDTYTPSDGLSGRWTSLYHGVTEAIRNHPDNIIVLFSDGADNYSQNHGGVTLATVEELIDAHETVVYSIGSGNVAQEFDRAGVSGMDALERLSTNGSVRLATQDDTMSSLFANVENHITAVYTCDYYSPNLSGQHTLQIGVALDDRYGVSDDLLFTAPGVQ
ncbi:MAG: hypothetical protein AAF581_04730 [Planctomycetota bacterium]